MIRAGFARCDLEESLRPSVPVREERVEAIAMYVSDGVTEALWITLDFMDFNLYVVDTIRRGVALVTKIDIEHVHIVTTHNHGGGDPDVEKLTDLCALASAEAVSSAVPVKIRYAVGDCDRQVNFVRRIYIPELHGVTTLWYGADSDDGFDSAPFVENAVESLKEGRLEYIGSRSTNRPFKPLLPGDSEVFAIEFCDANGCTVGSVVRFAAHAVCCNRADSFSSDYPWHVRKNMEKHLGGICVFWNGPCGDIAPAVKDKYSGVEQKLGQYVAQVALSLLSEAEFDDCEVFSDATAVFSLPVRDEVIKNHISTGDSLPDSLPERRIFLENIRCAETMPFLREKYAEGENTLSSEIDICLGFIRLGKLCIAAFPGETFSSTAKKFCDEFFDEDICTITEHGRTVMYIPPYDECENGGYESVCRVTARGAERQLLSGAIDAFRKFKNKV